jgi:hypothetical protein
LAVTLGVLASITAPVSASAKDYANIARDIVPSGQYGASSPPPQATQQAQMYNALTPLFNHVTSSDLLADFKPDSLGASAVGPFTTEAVPRAGVILRRDPYHVPQIIGRTRDDVTWGAGWVVAEDRGLLLQQARYDSLVAAIDAPGLNALNLVSSLRNFKPSAQTEHEVAKQTATLQASGANGRGVLHDLHVYLQGINAYIDSHGDTLGPFSHVAHFTLIDIYAFNALKDQFVGEGGGDEAVRSEFLSALRRRLGSKRGTGSIRTCARPTIPRPRRRFPGTSPSSLRRPAPRGTSTWTRTASRPRPVLPLPCRASIASTPQTPCSCRANDQPPTIRSWSPVRRLVTTTQASRSRWISKGPASASAG